MRIVLTRSGGFAGLPAMTGRVVIDTATLTPAAREELERLAGTVDLATLAAETVPPGSADHITYGLTVLDDGAQASATFVSPISDPDVAALVSRLERIARDDTAG